MKSYCKSFLKSCLVAPALCFGLMKMTLFRFVLLRATVPFLFILAVKWLQDSNLNHHGTLFCVLFSFAIWCLLSWYCSNSRNKFAQWTNMNLLISILFISSIFVHVQKISEKKREFLHDHVWTFLDYRTIFNTALQNIIFVTSGVYRLYRRLGIGPVTILTYLTWIVINSVILVWLLNVIHTITVTSAVVIFSKNIFYTFRENNTHNYPDGYLIDSLLGPKDLSKTAYVTDTYRSTDERTSFSHSFSTSHSKYPLSQKVIQRYVGEGVEFDCSHLNTGTINKDNKRLVWFHNNIMLKKSQRHSIPKPYDTIGTDSTYKYEVTASLYVERLQVEDFGEYKCVYEQIITHGNEIDIIKITAVTYQLTMIVSQPRVLYRSVGSLIASETDLFYHTKTDPGDISIRYTVNGHLLEDTCPGFDTTVCSISQSMISLMIMIGLENIAYNGSPMFPYLKIDELTYHHAKQAIIYFCVCDKAFGIHKISFLHSYFNQRTKSYQTEEYEHPFMFVILPEASLSWFRWQDDTDIYKRLEELIKTEKNKDKIEEEVLRVVDFISMSEKKVLLDANIVESLIALIGLSIYVILIHHVVRIYTYVFNVSIIRYLASRAIQHQLLLAIEGDIPSLYISHSEDQNGLVLEVLVPFIEQECNRKAFSSQRDCIPGTNILHSFVGNINRSNQIIVILSESYMADPECNKAQLEHLILPLLYESKIPLKKVLFIKYNYTDRIPQPLQWNLDVCVIPWHIGLDKDYQLQRIMRWIATGDVY